MLGLSRKRRYVLSLASCWIMTLLCGICHAQSYSYQLLTTHGPNPSGGTLTNNSHGYGTTTDGNYGGTAFAPGQVGASCTASGDVTYTFTWSGPQGTAPDHVIQKTFVSAWCASIPGGTCDDGLGDPAVNGASSGTHYKSIAGGQTVTVTVSGASATGLSGYASSAWHIPMTAASATVEMSVSLTPGTVSVAYQNDPTYHKGPDNNSPEANSNPDISNKVGDVGYDSVSVDFTTTPPTIKALPFNIGFSETSYLYGTDSGAAFTLQWDVTADKCTYVDTGNLTCTLNYSSSDILALINGSPNDVVVKCTETIPSDGWSASGQYKMRVHAPAENVQVAHVVGAWTGDSPIAGQTNVGNTTSIAVSPVYTWTSTSSKSITFSITSPPLVCLAGGLIGMGYSWTPGQAVSYSPAAATVPVPPGSYAVFTLWHDSQWDHVTGSGYGSTGYLGVVSADTNSKDAYSWSVTTVAGTHS